MLSDPANAYGVTAFAPSAIKQIDVLIELLGRDESTRASSVFEEIDSILGSLYAIYLNELQFLASGEPQNVAANQIASDFSVLRPVVAALRNELGFSEAGNAVESARELKEAVDQLFASFAAMKAQAAEGPRYSELPFTQELLRVLYHHLDGALAVGSVQERLDAFCNYHDNLEVQFEAMVPTAEEAPIFEARREDLEEALAMQLQGIEDLDVALERRSDRGMKKAAVTLKEAAGHLHAIYLELNEAAQQQPTVTCFRCGASNSAEARLCANCSAALPRFDAGSFGGGGSRSTIEIKESGEAGSEVPEELAKLQGAVANALRGNSSEILETALAGYKKKLDTITARVEKMKEAPADIPAGHLELLQEGKVRFSESLEFLHNGYELMAEGAARLDQALLRRGLEEIEEGYRVMGGFSEVFQRAEQASAAP